MNKVIMFFIGFIMSAVGLSYMIIYLNLFSLGFTFEEYLGYIFSKCECLLFFPGYLILVILVFKRRKR